MRALRARAKRDRLARNRNGPGNLFAIHRAADLQRWHAPGSIRPVLNLQFDPPVQRRPRLRPLALRAARSLGYASGVVVASVEVLRHLVRPGPASAE